MVATTKAALPQGPSPALTPDGAPTKPQRPRRLTGNSLSVYGQKVGLLTGQQRAVALKVSRSHLMHVERGAIYPGPALIDRMSDLYRKPVDVIVRAANLARETLAHRMLAQSREID